MSLQAFVIGATYVLVALLVVVGLRRMNAPRAARGGLPWAGWGVALAALATCLWPGLSLTNLALAAVAVAVGGGLAWRAGRSAGTTGLPHLAALYTGMGAGVAAGISAMSLADGAELGLATTLLAVAGGLAGGLACAGGLVAFARLRGWMPRPIRFASQSQAGASVLLFAAIMGLMLMGDYPGHGAMTAAFFALALAAGVLFTVRVGDAGLPVAVALYNTLTGAAVVFVGLLLDNAAMVVVGSLVASAAALLTGRMARGIGRPLGGLLFGTLGDVPGGAD